VSQKNDTDIAHYNFNAHQPIFVIFDRDIAEWVRYQMMSTLQLDSFWWRCITLPLH